MLRIISCFFLMMFLWNPAQAATNEDEGITTKLFRDTCMSYMGETDKLREWIKLARLIKLDAFDSKQFLYGKPGIVYAAPTATGKHVVVLHDDGMCRVVAMHANADIIIQFIQNSFTAARGNVELMSDVSNKEMNISQRIYKATPATGTGWIFSVLSVPFKDTPKDLPQVTLTTTALPK